MDIKGFKFSLLGAMILAGISFSGPQAGTIHPALKGPSRFLTTGDSLDVWVMFSDRGFESALALNRAIAQADESLLPHARQRRLKMNHPSLITEGDLPVNAAYVQAVLQIGGRYRTVSRYINALSLRVKQNHLQAIAELPFVLGIQPVAKAGRPPEPEGWGESAGQIPQPPGTDLLDYGPSFAQLSQINVIAAHDQGLSGAGVLVCLLDTGFFTDHEALIHQPVIAEWDFINNDPETQNQPGDSSSQHNHGTFTFSALGGAHEGDLYGPAYGATFIIGKTESVPFEQPIEEDWYLAGLEWADSLGADVVSTSLGYFDWYTFEDLDGNTCVTTIGVDNAVANGIVCVTAAGNERGSSWGHIIAPADADSVITVGAVNSQGQLASFSSPGPTYDGRIKPDVCARGVSTWCAAPYGSQPTTNYAGVGGTSLSTPLVGGSCALLLEAHPNWTPMQVRHALRETASNAATPDNDYGWGIINVLDAINYSFSPTIILRYPELSNVSVFQDSLQLFWISASDPEGDSLRFDWWIDTTLVQSGPDSQFTFVWGQPDTVLV
ncbi:MAG TPA: S8 family serine peptidase, partial [bacterium]